MIYIADNDIVVKFAMLDIVELALAALGASTADVRLLPTAKYSLHVAKAPARGAKKYGDAAHARIVQFVDAVEVLDGDYDQELVDALSQEPEVDGGEAVLFAAAAKHAGSLVLTNDKRSVRALAKSERDDVRASLRGRIVCLEQIVALVVRANDFDEVLRRVVPGSACDTAIRAAFGSGAQSTRPNVEAALAGYVAALRGEVGELLRA